MIRAILILLLLAGLSAVGYRAWTRAQYVPAAEVAASIQARLSSVRAEERAKPATTPEGKALLERALRGARAMDDAIDGELPSALQDALSKRFESDEWSSLTSAEKSLIANHPPVNAALAGWNEGDPLTDEPVGHPGSLSLHFQLVWLGEDVAEAADSSVDFAGSLTDALLVVAELYATQDDVAWLEGSRVLVWLEPRLQEKLGTLSDSGRQALLTAAALLQERLPAKNQFLAQAQLGELEDALELTAATGPDAAEIINNLYHYTQVLETCIPKLKAVADLSTENDDELQVREAELARLVEEFEELPLGPSILASVCLNTLQAADACHASVAAIIGLLGA